MFKKNTKHQQPALISAASELPEKQRKRLENSWAGAFYQEFFNRIDKEAFAVLYSEKASRPNVPVNVLVGLEALKAGMGWSDEELYENYCYNLQVRYALGYDRLGDGDFEIRTLYYFRERLSRYNAEKSINLLERTFEQITDAQITTLKVRTGMQRMDSTQIASNIVWASRLQLLVEGKPSKVTCPQGQTAPVEINTRQKSFVAHFDPAVCQTCPLLDRCPAQPGKRDGRHHLHFTQTEARAAERRKMSQEHAQDRHNLRLAVESSVRSLKHPFPAGKLPVRGRFRVACMMIGSAAMTNVRRIQRYMVTKIKAAQDILNEKDQQVAAQDSFFATLERFLAGWLCTRPAYALIFDC